MISIASDGLLGEIEADQKSKIVRMTMGKDRKEMFPLAKDNTELHKNFSCVFTLNPEIIKRKADAVPHVRKRPDGESRGREEFVSMPEILCSVANNPTISTVLVQLNTEGRCQE